MSLTRRCLFCYGCAGGLSLRQHRLVIASSSPPALAALCLNRFGGGGGWFLLLLGCGYSSRARCKAQIQRLGSDELEFHEALEPVDSSETLGQRGGVCL